MEWLDKNGMFFLCVLLYVNVVASHALPFEEFGVVTAKDGTFRFIGETLELYCNITDKTLRENSSMLQFERKTKKDNSIVPPEFIEVLTTKTIRLRIPNLDIHDDGVYTCFLQKFSGRKEVIDSKQIDVDYKPRKIENISCRVYNWDNMNCTWDLGVKYQHPEYINVSLAWTIQLHKNSVSYGDQFDCLEITSTSCFWKDYHHGHIYHMLIEISTIVGGRELFKERSPQFTVETQLYVQPAPVKNLMATVINSTCVELKWRHDVLKPMFFLAEFKAVGEERWGPVIINQDRFSEVLTGRYNSTVCTLKPNTKYEFRIAVLPFPVETKAENQGYLSDWRMVYATTFEDVPGAAPDICNGCFSELRCIDNESSRCVRIHFQGLKEKDKHGILKSYNITYTNIETGIKQSLLLPVPESKALTSVNLTLPSKNQNYKITITPSTGQGFSASSSQFFLPSFQRKPSPPSNFLVETDRKDEGKEVVFYLSWAALNVDSKTGHKYSNVTIVWCLGHRQDTECKDQVHWIQLPADHVTYELRPQALERKHNDFLIGITAEVFDGNQTVSSGIHWSTCTYLRNEQPKSTPKNVHESSKHPLNGLTILWDKFQCSEERSFVTEYLIKYCPSSGGTCTESEKSLNVSSNASEVTLENLKENVKYLLTVTAVSSAGLGPSESIVSAAVKGSPADNTVAGTVGIVAAISIALLIVIILVIICRYFINRKKRLPKTDDFIAPYAQSSVNCSNKRYPDFQNRPLPKTPEDQHFYGSSACMNNHGSDRDNHSSESEDSITSQSRLLSPPPQVSHNLPNEASRSKEEVDDGTSEENIFSKRHLKTLLKQNCGSLNHLSDAVNSKSLSHTAGDSQSQPDYCTIGLTGSGDPIDHDSTHVVDEFIFFKPSQNFTAVNNSQKSNSLSSNQKPIWDSEPEKPTSLFQSQSKELPDYHIISMENLDHNILSDGADSRAEDFSNFNTLPLRGYSFEMPVYPIMETVLPAVGPFSSCIIVGHGVNVTPDNLTSPDTHQTIYPNDHSFESTTNNMFTNSTLSNSLPSCSNSEYVTHSLVAYKPNDLPCKIQPLDYSRLIETPDSYTGSVPIKSFSDFVMSPSSSPPSPCPADPLHFEYNPPFQFPSGELEMPEAASETRRSLVNNNGYTRWQDFPQSAPNCGHPVLPPYRCDIPEIATVINTLNISPASNPDV